MPELPEVETVVRDLREKIISDTIVDFWSVWSKAIKGQSLTKFKKEIVGRKILGVRRLGKNIFVDLSEGKTLYLHLKMTGHLLVKTEKLVKEKDYFSDKVNQYVRHGWILKNKKGEIKNLEFSDMRKFAKIVLKDIEKIAQLPEIQALGVDAVSPEFTQTRFDAILEQKKKSHIGITLMDQHLIAGIGNIYRSEILFLAGVLPERKNETFLKEERKKIFQAIRSILKKAIRLRGTTDSDYRDTSGAPGGFQKILKVYGRAGKECLKCGTIITREIIGQRAVFFCPKCQK